MDPQAIFENFRRTVTEHYFDMNGRVGRPQFWYFVLAYAVVSIGLAIVQMAVFFLPLMTLFGLAMLLPAAGMGARRLQDVGQNGQLIWVLIIPSFVIQLIGLLMWGPFGALGFLAFYFTIGWLLNLVAVIAALVALYFWVQPGDPNPNAYGPPPPVFDPSKRVSPSP
jgi:uncharacterized membrane protein YhaH (DUF805 family)